MHDARYQSRTSTGLKSHHRTDVPFICTGQAEPIGCAFRDREVSIYLCHELCGHGLDFGMCFSSLGDERQVCQGQKGIMRFVGSFECDR